ncbi:glycerol uptake operon antiterminator [Tindallia magadiensis]|uniref:Glycerol uptake operon antiterminator n=1 Tax=Tindallia magadiensis TaxID=69895 RepID=A0A1I3E4R4_9FIRM|nr:glycerol-3-phosphate responsive antiterminator [Tindallia magadiensis]SFH93803.1 glycerol uptake operon antiterminator [Tindallia magadiensis]
MTKSKFLETLEISPINAAIKKEEDLNDLIGLDLSFVFVLSSDIIRLEDIVKKLQKQGKFPFVHTDMLTGMASNPILVDYFYKKFGNSCGILTTKNSIVEAAVRKDIRVVQRVFLIDSISVEVNIRSLKKNTPDAIEVMPGVIPKGIRFLKKEMKSIPIIAGGLVETKEEIMEALKAGGVGVSTTKKALWTL